MILFLQLSSTIKFKSFVYKVSIPPIYYLSIPIFTYNLGIGTYTCSIYTSMSNEQLHWFTFRYMFAFIHIPLILSAENKLDQFYKRE